MYAADFQAVEDALISVCTDCRRWIVETKFLERCGPLPEESTRECFERCINQALKDENIRLDEKLKRLEQKNERLRSKNKAMDEIRASVEPYINRPIDYPRTMSLSRAVTTARRCSGLDDQQSKTMEDFLRKHNIYPDDESADTTGIGQVENAIKLMDSIHFDSDSDISEEDEDA